MSSFQVPHGPVPLIGAQAMAEQQAIRATYHHLYFSLVPVAAAKLLDRQSMSDSFLEESPDEEIPEQIAQLAERVAIAAMARLGITICPRGEAPQP